VSAEREFAKALAAALGRLYRVSIVDAGGKVEASFGESAPRTSRTEIPLPKGSMVLRLEFDVEALEAAKRLVAALAPEQDAAERPGASYMWTRPFTS
jgi:hypothetical protein